MQWFTPQNTPRKKLDMFDMTTTVLLLYLSVYVCDSNKVNKFVCSV